MFCKKLKDSKLNLISVHRLDDSCGHNGCTTDESWSCNFVRCALTFVRSQIRTSQKFRPFLWGAALFGQHVSFFECRSASRHGARGCDDGERRCLRAHAAAPGEPP